MIIDLEGRIDESKVFCLWTSLVVSYGRPFTHNNKIGPIRTDLVPEKQKRLHKLLWNMRNKICGHTDHETVLDNGEPLLTAKIEKIDGLIRASFAGGRPNHTYLTDILELISSVKKACELEWRDRLNKIIPHQSFPIGKYVISLSEQSDDLFLRT